MKMYAAHKRKLQALLVDTVKQHKARVAMHFGEVALAYYREGKSHSQLAERLRWDLATSTPELRRFLSEQYAAELNDDHIDTALHAVWPAVEAELTKED